MYLNSLSKCSYLLGCRTNSSGFIHAWFRCLLFCLLCKSTIPHNYFQVLMSLHFACSKKLRNSVRPNRLENVQLLPEIGIEIIWRKVCLVLITLTKITFAKWCFLFDILWRFSFFRLSKNCKIQMQFIGKFKLKFVV